MVNKITTPPTTSELIGKVNEIIDDKQDTLISGTNIKTINNTSILGSGNIDIQGGGGSYTAGTGIDITNDVISVTSAISSGASAGSTAVQPADLSTYVTTNTAQDITARKTFFGEKAIHFKQNTASNKLGFTLYNNSSKEVGALEFRPNSVDGTPILTLNSSSPLASTSYGNSYVGFRYWNYSLNILAPFSTSLRSKNLFIPVTFTNGTTAIESTSTDGSVDISSLLPTVNNSIITFTQGGTTKGTITLNQSSNQTIAFDAGGSDVEAFTAAEVQTLWESL